MSDLLKQGFDPELRRAGLREINGRCLTRIGGDGWGEDFRGKNLDAGKPGEISLLDLSQNRGGGVVILSKDLPKVSKRIRSRSPR